MTWHFVSIVTVTIIVLSKNDDVCSGGSTNQNTTQQEIIWKVSKTGWITGIRCVSWLPIHSFCFLIYQMFRSEEDNDPLTDDAHSAISVPIAISRHSNTSNNPRNPHLRPSSAFRGKHHLAHNLVSDSDAGIDSPTYDGDIESSTTAGADTHKISYHHHSTSSISTINTTPNLTPSFEPSNPISLMRSTNPASHHPVFISPPMSTSAVADEPSVAAASITAFNPAALTAEDIQSFVTKAIAGESKRGYKINPPPVGRPVRIYADGMFRFLPLFPLSDYNHIIRRLWPFPFRVRAFISPLFLN